MATALEWKAQMAANPHISSTDIGKEVGLIAGRVRQILRLMKPHPNLQKDILALPRAEAQRLYPEYLLRRLIVLSPDGQVERYALLASRLKR